jgi:hypothetical protein
MVVVKEYCASSKTQQRVWDFWLYWYNIRWRLYFDAQRRPRPAAQESFLHSFIHAVDDDADDLFDLDTRSAL